MASRGLQAPRPVQTVCLQLTAQSPLTEPAGLLRTGGRHKQHSEYKVKNKPGVVVHPTIPTLGRPRQEGSKFKVGLYY